MSTLSQVRRNRDRSDNASLLTVDEITAEVEHRRASVIQFDESEEEEDVVELGTSIPGPLPLDDESGDEASDDESDDSDAKSDSDENEYGRAFTSAGCEFSD